MPPFANHLFISYAHIDNYRYSGIDKGWVDLLHERLKIRLAQLLGKEPKIWRDSKLTGHDIFNQTIVIELGQTAILLSVLTPRYLESTSCCSELNGFCQIVSQNGRLMFGNKHRVFKVVKTPVLPEEHPPKLRDLLGYVFYAQDDASEYFYEFDHEIGPKGERDKRYWNKFEDLAQDMAGLLKRMEGGKTRQPRATVYLADTTSDREEDREAVKRELEGFGHLILPDKPLPRRALDLQSTVREYLKQSRLSVHMIGKSYGVTPEDSERSVVCLQQELAIERGDDDSFSRLIWLPPELKPEDERQQRYVETLRKTFSSRNGSDLIESKIEDFKEIVKAKLNPVAPKLTAAEADDGLERVYLVCDQSDIEAVQPLYNFLYAEGFEVLLPSTTSLALQENIQNLVLCDAVLFYYGKSSETGLRTQLRELPKAKVYGRTRPFRAIGIYIAQPKAPQKELFQTREVKAEIIRNFGDFNPAQLAEFIKQIKTAKGGAQ